MDAASVIVALPLDPRFTGDLAALSLADLEAWIARPPAAPSTIGRRAATFRRFFTWTVRYDLCAGDPLAGYAAARVRRRLPRPIREVADPRAKLLQGAAWEAARPQVCHGLGHTTDATAGLDTLARQLDASYRRTAAYLASNPFVRVERVKGATR